MSSYPTGSSPETQRYNQPRECIRQFFPRRKCFVFDQPARKRDLVRLEELEDDEIDPEFQQQVEKFCSHVWETSALKTIPGGHVITGNCEYCCPEGWVASSSWDRVWRRIRCRVKRCRWAKGELLCWLPSLPLDLELLGVAGGVGKS